MYCTHCGAWNPDESKYCAKCGRRLEEVQGTPKAGEWQRYAPVVAGAALVVLTLLVCLGIYAARDRLSDTFQGWLSSPTAAPATPSPTLTSEQVPPTSAPTATATAGPTSTPTPVPTATSVPTPTPSPTAKERAFKLVYRDCIPHGFSLGSVKGQVFDRSGQVLPGARVRITINGYEWQSAANPAVTNVDGWYEWTLEVGQKVQFVEFIVDGKSVPFSPTGFEVTATSSCFQRVDFVEQ
jgi:hypothetical protein